MAVAGSRSTVLPAAVALVVGVLMAVAPPALAKKPKPPACDGRFVVEAPLPLLPEGAASQLEVMVVNGKTLAFGPGCVSAPGSVKATRTGWRVRTKWKTVCGGLTKARFSGTITGACGELAGTLRARGRAPMHVVARASHCGDGKVDAGRSEDCDPSDGARCVDCRLALTTPTTTVTATPGVTATTTATTTTTTTLALPPDCGDGDQDTDEECDGDDLGGAVCPEGSAGGGVVTCRPDCRLEWSACPACAGSNFANTWDAIQQTIFVRHDCLNAACHGAAQQAGLDLRPEGAYDQLLEVPSIGVPQLNRLEPGDQRRSYLWLKLAAKTDPSAIPASITVTGNPMPSVGAALSADELEALRVWIYAGAPEHGTVKGTERLLNACLPPPRPLLIDPLPPPPAGDGVQFAMPVWPLPHESEHEVCFATYYDITDQVPAGFKDPSGTLFRFSGQELRQDAQSHHLILYRFFPAVTTDDATLVRDPAWGRWNCVGGERAGQDCDPIARDSCGADGLCATEPQRTFACVGYGPAGQRTPIGGAQKAQSFTQYPDGVFAQIPMKGVLLWNSHAFNLTPKDTVMHGWLNYHFAKSQRTPLAGIFNASAIFAANAAPFTKQNVCRPNTLPRYARLFSLSSHTHQRGERFWITHPDGTTLYENFVYNDPPNKEFTPPLVFDSSDATQRTLTYCATYNNGQRPDGSPDIDKVTRRSRTPQSAIAPCKAVACVAGKIGASCAVGTGNNAGDDRACDSVPGANDGWCDACPITGGESTENEMFILIGSYYVQRPTATTTTLASARIAQATTAAADPERSQSTEIALPPPISCGAAHMSMGHGAHAGHAR